MRLVSIFLSFVARLHSACFCPQLCTKTGWVKTKVFSDRFFNALVGRRELNTRVTHIKHPCFASFFLVKFVPMMQLVQTWHYQGELTLVTAKNIAYDEPASKGKPYHFAKLLLFSKHLLYHQSKSSYSYCMQVGVLSIERVLKGEKVQVCSELYYSTNSWL